MHTGDIYYHRYSRCFAEKMKNKLRAPPANYWREYHNCISDSIWCHVDILKYLPTFYLCMSIWLLPLFFPSCKRPRTSCANFFLNTWRKERNSNISCRQETASRSTSRSRSPVWTQPLYKEILSLNSHEVSSVCVLIHEIVIIKESL